jgi:hypothetical protein
MFNTMGSLMLAGMLAQAPRCVRWTWTGDIHNRQVVCLEWTNPPKEKDLKTDQNKKKTT